MKMLIKTFAIAICLFMLSTAVQAQSVPPPPPPQHGQGGNSPPGGGAPIGAGAGIMLLMAAAYGAKQWYDARQLTEE